MVRLAWVLLLLGTLTLPVTSQATVVVDGSASFRAKVEAALAMIKAADPLLEALIDKLEQSSNVHSIHRRKSGGSESMSRGSPKDSGTGSRTFWNDTNTKPTTNDTARDPIAILVHELTHACSFDDGTFTTDVDRLVSKIKFEEIQAVFSENVYRSTAGLPPRRKYGGKAMPATPQLCETCTEGKECDGECTLPNHMCFPSGDDCRCIQFSPITPPCGPLEADGQEGCYGTCPPDMPICRNFNLEPGGPLECLCTFF